jgi:hypothetical protein
LAIELNVRLNRSEQHHQHGMATITVRIFTLFVDSVAARGAASKRGSAPTGCNGQAAGSLTRDLLV